MRQYARPRQPAPVLIGQPHAASVQLRAEDPIFFSQIRHGRLPLVTPPANAINMNRSAAPSITAGVYTINIDR